VSVLFVTGTDTGVGKTVVAAAIAASQLALGRRVAAVKPAQTGVGPDEDGDLAELRRLGGELSLHEGVRLEHPLAPATAGRPRPAEPGRPAQPGGGHGARA
jgi:dethiobiotin synthetase